MIFLEAIPIAIWTLSDTIQLGAFFVTIASIAIYFNTRIVKLESSKDEVVLRNIPFIMSKLSEHERMVTGISKDLTEAINRLNISVSELKQVLDILLKDREKDD